MTKHTPGPWALHPRMRGLIVPAEHVERPIGASSIPADDIARYAMEIAKVHNDWHGRLDQFANARLIAAAPDMLAALEDARMVLTQGKGVRADTPVIRAIDAAIAKATGGDQ